MTTTVNLSPELIANLQVLAEDSQTSIDDLVETIVSQHISELGVIEGVYYPSSQELVELQKAFATYELEKAARQLIPIEEAQKMSLEKIAAYKHKAQGNANAG